MNTGLIAGTFDPPTLGHLNIIERASQLCQKLFVGVAHHLEKRVAFSQEERINLLEELLVSFSNVEVVMIKGLVVDFAKSHNVDCLFRGLRPTETTCEFQMALANKKLSDIETLFLPADGQLFHISSSLIREVAASGHHLKDFLPLAIEEKVRRRLAVLLNKSEL